MKILYLITGLSQGGAERVVCDLADEMVKYGHEVKIVFLTGEISIRPSNRSIQIINLNLDGFSSLYKSYLQLSKIIRVYNPDVLHSHMVHANILSRLIRVTTPIPKLINTAHSSYEGGKLRMLAYRLTDSLADISTNVSTAALQTFRSKNIMSIDKSIVIYNGIDTNKFLYNEESRQSIRKQLSLDSKEFLFLSVGRLVDAKDYPNLLIAFSHLLQNNSSSKLAIVGKGELETELKQFIKKLGISQSVYFLGARNDVDKIMSACDCFVLPSKYEGFGLVVAEAMSCERIVIGTDCGGVKEVIGNEGFLIEPENYIALADAMQKAIDLDYEQRKLMGHKARQRIIKNYSLNAAVSKWLELYKDPKRA